MKTSHFFLVTLAMLRVVEDLGGRKGEQGFHVRLSWPRAPHLPSGDAVVRVLDDTNHCEIQRCDFPLLYISVTQVGSSWLVAAQETSSKLQNETFFSTVPMRGFQQIGSIQESAR